MSEQEIDRTPREPEMDEQTYALIQELLQLVRSGSGERLAGLLEMGLSPNFRDSKGNSLLMLASYNRNYETTRVLLEHGADTELANDNGQLPLAGAAFNGDTKIGRLLLENGARVNGQGPDGKTALMFAAMFNRVEFMNLLLEKGADPFLQSADGTTALALAQGMGARDAADRLGQAVSRKEDAEG
jgi:ankyrin repeat protein